MNHINRPRLEAFLDGELGYAEARGIEAHLNQCDSCRREAEGLQRLITAVRRARTLDPRRAGLETFAEETVRRAKKGRQRAPAWWQRIRFVWNMEWGMLQRGAAVACALAVLVGGGLVIEQGLLPEGEASPACRIEFIEPGPGANVTVYSDADVAVVWVSGGDTG